jgi:triphosphoribosyl-dephospho-CoA synthetase
MTFQERSHRNCVVHAYHRVRCLLVGAMIELEHKVNPLTIYCRLVNRNINRKTSMRVSRFYELVVYRWLIVLIAVSISLCRVGRHTVGRL